LIVSFGGVFTLSVPFIYLLPGSPIYMVFSVNRFATSVLFLLFFLGVTLGQGNQNKHLVFGLVFGFQRPHSNK
jgi:hypothetical protein